MHCAHAIQPLLLSQPFVHRHLADWQPANLAARRAVNRCSHFLWSFGPSCGLCDGCFTGLSPEARRQVWDIVTKQKTIGRTIVITTHSMEEADTLCSKIGIMAKASLLVRFPSVSSNRFL